MAQLLVPTNNTTGPELMAKLYRVHHRLHQLGNESHAVAEHVPFQKVSTEKKKPVSRNNTINQEEDYLSFLEMFKLTKSVSLEALRKWTSHCALDWSQSLPLNHLHLR
ncbi:hypothetical protein V8E55_010087 [Tylopilus felleus]